MINKVTLIGNLGKDPEIRHLESGSSVARFSIATNESYRDKAGEWQTQTEWHTIIMWRYLAQRAERELKKGSLIYVEGRLRTRSYQDTNGVERTVTEIEAQTYRSLDRKDRNDASFPTSENEPRKFGAPASGQSNPNPIAAAAPTTPVDTSPSAPPVTNTPPTKAADLPEDDLPF